MSRQETDPRLLESRGSGRQLGRFDFRLMVEALNQSQHPTDVLVRAIIDSGRRASQVEVEAIRQRLRSAPFSTRTIRVPPALRTGPSAASALGPSNNALAVHVAQRISLDRQWATTSPELFLEDLRASVEAVSTRMVLYRDRGGAIALAIAATADVIPPPRLGAGAQALLVMVYSADRGTIVSGYQASSLARIRIGENAIWLP